MELSERRKDLTDDQIGGVASYWYDTHIGHPHNRERKKCRFFDSFNKSSDVNQMARDSLLLDILIRANNYQELPKYKLPLYKLCAQFLLNDWDIERLLDSTPNKGRLLDSQDKTEILQAVAANMRTDFNSRLIVEHGLQVIIENKFKDLGFRHPKQTVEMVIKKLFYFQNHLLSHTGDAFYEFVDRRFFDYFHAMHFVELFERKRQIDIEHLKKEVFGRHWSEPSWHGTLVLIAAAIHEKFALELIQYLLVQSEGSQGFMNVFLAADCFIQMQGQMFDPNTRRVATILSAKLKSLANPKLYPDAIWRQASALCHELEW